MQKHEDNLATQVDGAGLVPMPGVTVTVIDQSTGLAAALYSDNGVTPITTSIVTDNTGYYGFFAADGRYTITFTNPRIVTFTRDVILEDPKDNPYATLAQLAAPTGSTLLSYANGGTQQTVSQMLDLLYFGVANARNPKFSGGMKGDGTTDDTTAWNALLASGQKNIYLPAGRYVLNKANTANLTNAGLSNINMIGDGPSSVLFLYGKNWCFTSPSHVTFQNLRFEGNPTNTDTAGTPTSIWCSNYTDITFDNCEFANFGGNTTKPDGTTCLYLYAGPTSSVAQAGSSTGAKVIKCRAYAGGDRATNFAVRVFTEWATGSSLAYANTGAQVIGCTFTGFNWNAVEFAGPMTSDGLIADCVANACGLTPFDFDKGANNCNGRNWIINGLLGNADTSTSPTTRAIIASIQGEATTGRIANNIHIDGVTCNLLASDIAAFAGNGGYAAAAMSMAQNCSIRNVNVSVDAVPTKNAAAQFALATVCFDNISGCRFQDVTTTNGTAGIIEVAAHGSAVGSNWNKFKSIHNIGTLKAEPILIAKGSSNAFKHKFEDVRFTTDFTVYITDVVSINLQSTAGIVSLERVYVSTPGYSVINASCPNVAIRDIYVDYAANSNNVNFFATGSNVANLVYTGAFFNGKPLDVYAAFPRLPSTTKVGSTYSPELAGATLPITGGGLSMYATAAPTNPTLTNWAYPAYVYNLLPSAGGTMGWVHYGSTAMKAMPNIAP